MVAGRVVFSALLGASLSLGCRPSTPGGPGVHEGLFSAMPVRFGSSALGLSAEASFLYSEPTTPELLGCPAPGLRAARVEPLSPSRVTVSVGPFINAPMAPRVPLGNYTFVSGDGAYGPGAAVTFRASGGDVPDVDVTVLAPPPLSVLEPTCREGRPPRCWSYDPQRCPPRCGPPLDRTRDLVVRWLPLSSGLVRVWIYSSGGATVDVTLPCVFDARTGSSVVPSRMLQLAGPDLLVQIEAVARTVTARGRFRFSADVSGPRQDLVFADR